MPIEGIQSGQNGLGIENTTSLWSPSVWQGFPVDAIRNGIVSGHLREKYFNKGFKPSTNVNAAEAYWDDGFMVFGDNGAAITTVAGVGLAGGVSIGSDGDNEGLSIRDQFAPFKIARSTKDLRFEIVLQTSTIADTKHGIFAGLIEDSASTATSPIAAAGTLADLNFVGFHRLEGDGDMFDCVYKANGVTQVTTLADAVTIVAATELRLAMTYSVAPDFDTNNRYTLRFWKNDLPIASAYKVIPSTDGDDFPNDIGLGIILCVLNATGTTPGTTTVKRVRCAQLLA